jgi:outer membrane protein assembly factor BamD (BamD/ComL family)
MGRKPNGAGKHVYLCLALLIFFAGCSSLLPESSRRREMRQSLAKGNDSLAQGDYAASLKAFEQVLGMAQGQPPADAAAYGVGLVYAHPQNPAMDRQKAIGSFNQLIAKFPASPLAEPAKIWVGVLNEAERSSQEIKKSKQVIEKSKQELEKTRLAVEESKLEIEKARAELEKSKQEIEKSKQMIEKSRQVDLEIEQKRRARRK